MRDPIEKKILIENNNWHDISTAPFEKWVPVWGHGRMRFMKKDEMGQWRNGHGAPRQEPKLWFSLPSPPQEKEPETSFEKIRDGLNDVREMVKAPKEK